MRRDIIQLGRNFLFSLGGEGLQSGFHFVLNLILIRLLSTHDFGVFAIAFVLGGISLTNGGNASQPARGGTFLVNSVATGGTNYSIAVQVAPERS